jgi:hypothetical protein
MFDSDVQYKMTVFISSLVDSEQNKIKYKKIYFTLNMFFFLSNLYILKNNCFFFTLVCVKC